MAEKTTNNVKATIAFGISAFVTSGINYILTPLFTRILTTSEYGIVSVYNAIYAVITVIATLTLVKPGILSVGLYEHKNNRWKYLSSMFGLITIATAATAFLTFFVWQLFKNKVNLPSSLVILMLLHCWLNPAMTFWTYKQKYEYNYKITMVVSIGSAVLAQLVSVFAVLYCHSHTSYNLAVVRLWSASVINLSVSAVLALYIIKKGKTVVDRPLWKSTIKFALPLIPHYLGFAFLNGTDKVMIDAMCGTDIAGIYSLAAIISTIGSLLWTALCVTVTPFINEKLGSRSLKEIDTAVKPLLILIGAVCILVTLLAPEIIWILGSEKYQMGIYVVPATVAGVFLHIVYDVFSHVSFFHKKPVRIMTATLTAAVANVILNYIFIKKFGFVAASYTTLLSFLLLAVMHYRNVRIIEPEKIFDIKQISLISLVVVAICIGATFIYDFAIIRYFLSAAIIAFVILKRKLFLSTIASMKV